MTRLASILLAILPVSAMGDDPHLEPLVALLAEVDDDSIRLDVLKGIDTAVTGRRNVGVPEGWNDVRTKLATSPNAEVREYATRLALVFGDQQAMQSLRRAAGDPWRPLDERRRAIELLAGVADPQFFPHLARLLTDAPVERETLRALAVYTDPSIPKLILDRYPKLGPAARRDAIATLSARKPWAVALLDAVGDEHIPSTDLSAFDARHLASLGDEKIDQLLAEVWGDVRPTSADRVRLMQEYARELEGDALERADLVAGRRVFKTTCAGCHQLFDDGRKVGPDLTGSQRFNVDYVLQNLLDPNALIGRDYRVTILVTDSGRIVSGLVAEETENAIIVRTATETVTVPVTEIEVRKQSKVSMMPEGMLQKLTAEQRRDLIAYLGVAGQVPLPQE